MRYRLRHVPVVMALALMTVLPFQAAEQYSASMSRAVNRAAPFTVLDADLFRYATLGRSRGVFSQTSRLIPESGTRGQFSVSLDLESGNYPGYITVRHAETRARYSIEYADLVPMALFVNNEGTVLYTLVTDDNLPAGEDFERDAGVVAHPAGGHVAFEFNETRYADALFFLDLCDECTGDDVSVSNDVREILRTTSDGEMDASYVNTDFRLPYLFDVDDAGNATVRGAIARYEWAAFLSSVSITAQELIREPESSFVPSLFFSDFEVLDELNAEVARAAASRVADEVERLNDTRQGFLEDGFFLFETLALLRTAKTDTPDDWTEFMDGLSADDALMRANPSSPWDLYADSLCRVYSDRDECRN